MFEETVNFVAFINNLRPLELIIIAFIVLLLFGAKRLPELFRSMGRALGEFKKATRDMEDEVRNAMDSESPASKTATSKPQGEPEAKEEKPKTEETIRNNS